MLQSTQAKTQTNIVLVCVTEPLLNEVSDILTCMQESLSSHI